MSLNGTYCDYGDSSCMACRSDIANPICRGETGCACQEICNLIQTDLSLCCSPSKARLFMWFIIGFACFALSLTFWLQLRWNLCRRQSAHSNRDHYSSCFGIVSANGSSLQLDGWRRHVLESNQPALQVEGRKIGLNPIFSRAHIVASQEQGTANLNDHAASSRSQEEGRADEEIGLVHKLEIAK